MSGRAGALPLVIAAFAAACGGGTTARGPSPASRQVAALPAVDAVRAARFADAVAAATTVLAADAENPQAAAARALGRTVEAWHGFLGEVEASVGRTFETRVLEHAAIRGALTKLEAALGEVDRDLVTAARDPEFALELCLACWERDWNRRGGVDDRDRKLFEIEVDATGQELPESDPRRRPTFRFDVGDLHWARAMIAFQRAALDLILAYRWDELDLITMAFAGGPPPRITIRLGDRARIDAAKAMVLTGLDEAAATRTAYLAETDDDREWVPNPKQQSHPMPLPIDALVYETWDGVVGDLRKLVRGEQALSLAQLGRLAEDDLPALSGYLDVGVIFSAPRDFDLDLARLEALKPEVPGELDGALKRMLGVLYVDKAEASPLPGRMARMKKELDRGEESFERKLRYLLWLN